MNDKEKLKAIEELFLPLPEWIEWEFNTPMSVDSSKMRRLKEILRSSASNMRDKDEN